MYVALPEFLLRAPLLRESDLVRARTALERHPLGPRAVALASEGAATATGDARARVWERYGRRAAFRATPHGLLAGVSLGRLASATRVETAAARPWLAPTWQRLAELGRALLDDEAVRPAIALRVAPSLMRGATTARWLAEPPHADGLREERTVDLDAWLGAILDATSDWTPWAVARRAAGRGGDADEVLLALIDEGLLVTDLTPPLVGVAPPLWARARLERLGRRADARTLARATAALARGELALGATLLEGLPRAENATRARPVHGALVLEGRPTLARAAVERAAALAPLLFRLQEALAPPASERLAQPSLEDALGAITETFGSGALDLQALATGEYGVEVSDDDGVRPSPDAAVVAALVDAALAAARTGAAFARLDVDALTALFADVGPAAPSTCELFLAPARTPRGAPDGTDWLLGLHAPAGATWGRFAAPLGAPMSRALATLAAAERAACPTDETLDVAFAPSAALADLCTHPRTRARVLALSAWSDDAVTSDLAPRDLELVAEPGAAAPLALREGRSGAPVTPSPLARVRSTTAPAGVSRLLAGWSLHRQHAPWVLPLGPLSSLAHLPRFVLDGFVVAPASWRLPTSTTRTALRRWRRALRVPRWVQLGHEDQLLPVDLEASETPRELAGHERVWEIWPPLGRTRDAGGRRVEAVVALVDHPDAEDAAAAAHATRATTSARRVAPPRAAGPARGWRTLKLFGAPAHQDALLLDVVAPTIAAAARDKEITGWFFQRYVEGPGARHHLRVRVRAPRAPAFEARLSKALAPARAAGAVVSVDATEYHPERARFGDELEVVHDIFQSDSELVCALLATTNDGAGDEGSDDDRMLALVRSLDALARGLGLDLEARRHVARARRVAEAGADDARDARDAEFRARARALRAALGDTTARDGAARALRAHVARTTRATKALRPEARAALAPALLHLACVRLGGPERALEHRAYTLWERTLEGLARAPVAPPVRARRA